MKGQVSTLERLRSANHVFLSRFLPEHFFEQGHEHDLRRATVILYFSSLMILIGPATVTLEWLAGNYQTVALNALIFLIFLSVPVAFVLTSSLQLAAQILIAFVFFTICLMSIGNGTFETPYLMALIVVPIVAMFLSGIAMGLVWSGVSLIFPLFFYMLTRGVELPILFKLEQPQVTRVYCIVGYTAITALIAYMYEAANMSSFDNLEKTNEALREAEIAAKAANKAKSTFLANMSHEIRTPLNAIIGYSEMLLEEMEEEQDSFAPDLARINHSGRHLLGLISDILDISKIEAGKMEFSPEEFLLSGLLDEVHATVAPLAETNDNQFLVEQVEPLEGKVFHDKTRLRQILINLLGNACKFTHKGSVTLRACPFEEEGKGWLRFEVIDTGIGIDAAALSKLFEPFSQVDASTTRKFGGTGLGLTITKKLTEKMGGGIDVSSEPGAGSIFVVELPRVFMVDAAPTESSDRLPVKHVPQLPKAKKEAEIPSILVIDDEPNALDLMTRFLLKEGFEVVTCSNGKAGIQIAKGLRPTGILLDVLMPGMNGWDVLAKLKEDHTTEDIPVIMHTILDEAKKGISLGATDYILKPAQPDQMLRTIRKHSPIHRGEAPILVVEDDFDARALLTRQLEKAGCSVKSAANGREAVDQMEACQPALVLLDLMMPEMDGFTFLQTIRARSQFKDTPVIVVTAKDLTKGEQEELKQSTIAVLQKGGYDIEQLLLQIREQLPPAEQARHLQ